MSSIGYQCPSAPLAAFAASVRKYIVFTDFREIRTFFLFAHNVVSRSIENEISRIWSPQVPAYLMILAALTQSLLFEAQARPNIHGGR